MTDEVLKELRENARTYLKLDFTYIVAAGAAVTVLKVNRYEILEITAEFWAIVVAYLFMFTFDAILHSILLEEWISAKMDKPKRTPMKAITTAITLQSVFHMLFLGGVVMFGVGVATGVSRSQHALEARALIQDHVDIFLAKNKRVPKSLDELRVSEPKVNRWLERLGNEPVSIEATGPANYRITFAGRDKTLGTGDDITGTPEVSIARILEAIENDVKGRTSDKK